MPFVSKILDVMQPVDPKHFEVAPEEEAIPFHAFQAMDQWSTRSCTDDPGFVTRRKWGHLLFLSHKWRAKGVPGSIEDLKKMQLVVNEHVQTVLREVRDKSGKATIKNVSSEEDFGIWLDYPIIPNDRSHVENCETCQQKRRTLIAKMNALPTVSTVIAFNPEDDKRGWILHELSNNSHGNVIDLEGSPLGGRLDHRHRINLMAKNRLCFTNGGDGDALRCYEFLRLGQMPRCWPSVSRVLLQEWKDEGISDESHPDALSILLKYARTFHYDCQRLKRAMIEIPQQLAWSGVERREESGWVQILSPRPNFSFDSGVKTLESGDSPFDFEVIRHKIEAQHIDMMALGLNRDICDATVVLQRMQFLAVTLGLRAELLHGSGQGLLHWIVLSSVTEALATTKRTVRLKGSEEKVHFTSCSIRLSQHTQQSEDLPASTVDVLSNGVPVSSLVFALDALHETDQWSSEEMNLSGVTMGLPVHESLG